MWHGTMWRMMTNSTARTALALAAVCACAAMGAGQVPCRYTVEYLPNPSPCPFWNRYIETTGISPNGRYVCGWTGDCGTNDLAVVVDTQTMQMMIIPRPPGVISMRAAAVNDEMEFCGSMKFCPGTGCDHAFIWRDGQITNLHPQGSWGSWAEALSNTGDVTGFYGTPDGTAAFIWRDGNMTTLNLPLGPNARGYAIDANGQVAGWMGDLFDEAFLWNGNNAVTLGHLPGGTTAWTRSIAPNGDIAGNASVPDINAPSGQSSRAFLYRNRNMWNLGLLPGATASRASATNGVTTVGHCDTPNGGAAFVYTNNLMRRLELLQPNPNVVIYSARGISNGGSIPAFGRVNGQAAGLILRPVPGPVSDITLDCRVNVSDLLGVINGWGQCASSAPFCPADLNGDGIVNQLDLLIVIQHWGQQS